LSEVLNIDPWFFPLVSALWIMIPAYVPNPAAVIFGGGPPIDEGATWRDGRRLFGDGKTVRGFVLGVLSGIAVGGVELWVQTHPGWSMNGYSLPLHTAVTISTFAAGALIGDLAKSFVKRRLGKGQGEPWPVADQYDLVCGAFLLTILLVPSWFFQNITIPVLLWILVLTPLLHRITNIAGHRLGVKRVPW
jgi:CDP-2,3-bis-(O-geranylgeranyl)-sn-glycerol synthase